MTSFRRGLRAAGCAVQPYEYSGNQIGKSPSPPMAFHLAGRIAMPFRARRQPADSASFFRLLRLSAPGVDTSSLSWHATLASIRPAGSFQPWTRESQPSSPPPRMFREPETNQGVAVENFGAGSCGKPASCLPPPPRFIPGSGPPPPGLAAAERGLAPQDGSDRKHHGSRKRIRAEAWSARPPFSLPGPGWMPGFENRIIARIGAGEHDHRSRRH